MSLRRLEEFMKKGLAKLRFKPTHRVVNIASMREKWYRRNVWIDGKQYEAQVLCERKLLLYENGATEIVRTPISVRLYQPILRRRMRR